MNSKAATVALEIRSLEAAVAEAKKRVAHAAAVETDAAERENARNALALLDDFENRGERLDHALEKFVREYDELVRVLSVLEWPRLSAEHDGLDREQHAAPRPNPPDVSATSQHLSRTSRTPNLRRCD